MFAELLYVRTELKNLSMKERAVLASETEVSTRTMRRIANSETGNFETNTIGRLYSALKERRVRAARKSRKAA